MTKIDNNVQIPKKCFKTQYFSISILSYKTLKVKKNCIFVL